MFQNFLKKKSSHQEDLFNHLSDKQLLVDVYQTVDTLVIRTPVAGVRLADIAITVTDDVLTIRGERQHYDEEVDSDFFYTRECHWGVFSRTIILPPHLKTDEINATFKHGILKIEIPKSEHVKTKSVPIQSTAKTLFQKKNL